MSLSILSDPSILLNDDETDNPRLTKKIKIRICFLGIIILAFVVLCALTASLPGTNESNDNEDSVKDGDTAWIIVASALVLLMTPGLALFYGGMVNHKNVISTMYQSFVSMGLISVIWVVFGFSLAYGKDANGSGILGDPSTYFMYRNVGSNPDPSFAPTIPLSIFSMFQLMFAIITPILISGSLAERVNFSSWLIFICIWHILVYCPLAHMTWHPNGRLRQWGYLDFAGGLVVEMASGVGALAAAKFLGPRKDTVTTPANIPFILLGTGLLWFGWLGFNAGSALAANGLACHAFATTNTAGASAMITWILLDFFFLDKTSTAVGACNGSVVGLVAITPGCGYVTVGGAMCIGCLSCMVCYISGLVFKERSSIDDSLEVFTIHGLGGICGVILTGFFSSKRVNSNGENGFLYGNWATLGKQLAVVVVAIPFIIFSTWSCCLITNFLIPLRVTEEQEKLGLDICMHSESVSNLTVNSESKVQTDVI